MTSSSSFCVTSPDRSIVPALVACIDAKTKPLGALGRLETLALQVGLVQQTLSPALRRPVMLVFAADHGVAAEGVSLFPAEVTFQMVLNFLAGGAAINVFARQNGMLLRVIDAGVNGDLPRHADLIDAKIAQGTRSFLREPAMTEAQCMAALARGRDLASLEAKAGSNVMGFGEMGIGNTSSAAALMSALCGMEPEFTVGRGTGLDEAGVARKREVITQALQLHRLPPEEPLRALAAVGGFEIAMMAGAMLGAAECGCLLLIDGFIASSALLVASRLQPAVLDYCIFAHRSNETAHARLLEHLGAMPLLDLGLRLGEGTGAALAYPLVQSACGFLNEMASFATAGVSASSAA